MDAIKVFLSGVGRSTDLGITRKRNRIPIIGSHYDDALAISNDWEVVGSDLQFAFDAYKKKTMNGAASARR